MYNVMIWTTSGKTNKSSSTYQFSRLSVFGTSINRSVEGPTVYRTKKRTLISKSSIFLCTERWTLISQSGQFLCIDRRTLVCRYAPDADSYWTIYSYFCTWRDGLWLVDLFRFLYTERQTLIGWSVQAPIQGETASDWLICSGSYTRRDRLWLVDLLRFLHRGRRTLIGWSVQVPIHGETDSDWLICSGSYTRRDGLWLVDLFRFLYTERRTLIGWSVQVPIHGETDSDWTSRGSSQDLTTLLPPFHLYAPPIYPPYSMPLPPPSLSYAQVSISFLYFLIPCLDLLVRFI